MRVGVGSGNPVKRRAVERVLESSRGADLADECSENPTTVTVESVPVSSGVSEQPTGHAETVAGAENRADAVLEAGAYDLGIGIEGGVAGFDGADGFSSSCGRWSRTGHGRVAEPGRASSFRPTSPRGSPAARSSVP